MAGRARSPDVRAPRWVRAVEYRLVDAETRTFTSRPMLVVEALAIAKQHPELGLVVYRVHAVGDDFRAMKLAGLAVPVTPEVEAHPFIVRQLCRELTESPIRKRRRALGITERDLAALAGVATGTINHTERGRFKPRPKNLRRILRALDDLEAGKVQAPPPRFGHGAVRRRGIAGASTRPSEPEVVHPRGKGRPRMPQSRGIELPATAAE